MPQKHAFGPRSFVYSATSSGCFPSSADPQLFCCALFSFLDFCLHVTNIKANLNNNQALQHVMNNSWWKILFSTAAFRTHINLGAATFSFTAI